MTTINRFPRIAVAILIAGSLAATASSTAPPRKLDLREAVALARSNNRSLEAARIRIEEARGDLTAASILLMDNPKVGLESGSRTPGLAGADDTTDISVGVEQTFEIGGQRRHRIRRAEANLAATEAATTNTERALELAVATVFWETLAADRRVLLLQESRSLAQTLFETARLRLERGEGTPLEQNTARIRLAEVERRLASERSQRRSSALRLAELLGLPQAEPLTLTGQFPKTVALDSEEALVARALSSRSDLVARDRLVKAAEEGARLAKAEARPDLSFGLSYEEEEDDQIVLAGVRVPLPFFNRNQGERQRTEAVTRRLRAEREAAALAVELDVRNAYSDYEQARQAVRLYDTEVLQAQEESLSLLEKAFEAGQIGYPEVIVVQREVLDGRDGHLSAQLDLALANARLLAALQKPQTDSEQELAQ